MPSVSRTLLLSLLVLAPAGCSEVVPPVAEVVVAKDLGLEVPSPPSPARKPDPPLPPSPGDVRDHALSVQRDGGRSQEVRSVRAIWQYPGQVKLAFSTEDRPCAEAAGGQNEDGATEFEILLYRFVRRDGRVGWTPHKTSFDGVFQHAWFGHERSNATDYGTTSNAAFRACDVVDLADGGFRGTVDVTIDGFPIGEGTRGRTQVVAAGQFTAEVCDKRKREAPPTELKIVFAGVTTYARSLLVRRREGYRWLQLVAGDADCDVKRGHQQLTVRLDIEDDGQLRDVRLSGGLPHNPTTETSVKTLEVNAGRWSDGASVSFDVDMLATGYPLRIEGELQMTKCRD